MSAVGVFVGLVSTSIQSLGLTLQRKSHILEDEKDLQDARRPPYRRRRWQVRMKDVLGREANLVGSTIQITTLPLPVLSTLQASGLVFNSICATLILGEPFTRWSFGGTVLVCGGAVLIAIFGAIAEPAHNLNQLLMLLGRRQFVLWMIGQAALVLAIIMGIQAFKFLNPRISNTPQIRLLRGMAYGCISGILSAHSLLVAKSAVELLVRTLIALGTVILLAGVLALSWRLSNDPITRPSIPQTPLTPGMGFVSDDSDSEAETSLLPNDEPADDEESQFPSESSPLFLSGHQSATANGKAYDGLTATIKTSLNQSRLHRRALAEADEIFRELEENDSPTSQSPFSNRRSSARSTPSRLRPHSAIENDNPNPPPPPDETTGLLARSSRGRSYREKRRRRSMPLGDSEGCKRRGDGAQDALGGWWKMRWWRGEGKGNGKDDDGRDAGA
ncbi:MAG: hypothetical protein Q9187_000859 [Circinaria calcarea]